MSEDLEPRKARKGTKSCTECRRRKVRCIRDQEGSQTCRRCEQHGSACVVQKYSSNPSGGPKISSRARISQLESQVASLSKAIQAIESKLGYQHTELSSATTAQTDVSHGADDTGDESSDLDMIAINPPSQIHSLFQNDWLSVDTPPQATMPQLWKAKGSSLLQNAARNTLQDLIPSRDEVAEIARSGSRWLDLLHSLLPQPFSAKTQQEVLESYNDMRRPDIDPTILASWLLTIALIAHQMPDDYESPPSSLERFSGFAKAVLDAVESKILSHDRLVCTVEGLSMAIHFFRLQMSQGSLQKAWLRIRYFRAVAELIGLPKTFQIVQSNKSRGVPSTETQIHRAQLWEVLTFVDGLSGTLINLPACVSQYRHSEESMLSVDGEVLPKAYLGKLTDIATKIQYDNSSFEQGSTNELYASVLDLDRQLQVLASQTPKTWWADDSEHVKPDHIVQFLHYCIKMRVHLFFAMQHDMDRDHIYSRLACADACETVAERYQFLRGKLPFRSFICQIIDLQVFTATVVLLLTSHSSPSSVHSNLRTDKVKIHTLVDQVIQIMDQKSSYNPGTNTAQNGVTSLRALRGLLQQDETNQMKELTLKIPLLGKVHIRRNTFTSKMPVSYQDNPRASSRGALNVPFQGGFRVDRVRPDSDIQMASASQTDEAFQWDPLSWSVENQFDDYPQDIFMADNMSQFESWQNGLGFAP